MIQVSRWKILLVVITTALGLLFSMPNFLSPSAREALPGYLPSKGLNLGLDLQGGSYMLLEVDVPALKHERLTNLIEDIRKTLQDEGINPIGLRQVGDSVTFTVTDPAQAKTAATLVDKLSTPVQSASGGATIKEFDITSGDAGLVTMTFSPRAIGVETRAAVDQSIEVIRRRIDKEGTKEMSILRQGANRIVIQAPGQNDPEALRRMIGKTAKLTFQMVDESVSPEDARRGLIPPGSVLLPQDGRPDEPFVLVKKRVMVPGESLTKASSVPDEYGRPAISFRFNADGARKFGDVTIRSIGKRFAIVLDGKVLSAPVIQSAIMGGSGQITGRFEQQEARELANMLQSGALPAKLTVQEQRTVGAELGADAVKAGGMATIVGFLAVVVFMIFAYGFLFGGISVVGLVVNGVLIVAAMSMTQATLTLPGIAGLILTLAVAVDANVLIYERMREEIRAGRSAIAACDAGFSRAIVTIIDANVTTLAAAGIMFSVGAGPVRGFAWTLGIGVVTSVFSAVLVSQVLIGWWLRSARPKKLPI
jgi:preprotein translocase subunit SecD